MHYVYILKSEVEDWHYVGYSADLRQRLKDHNEGKVASTKSRRPYTVASYIAVRKKKQPCTGEVFEKRIGFCVDEEAIAERFKSCLISEAFMIFEAFLIIEALA